MIDFQKAALERKIIAILRAKLVDTGIGDFSIRTIAKEVAKAVTEDVNDVTTKET